MSSAEDGTTPLHDAVSKRHTQIVKLLVKAGGNVTQLAPLLCTDAIFFNSGKRLLEVRQKDGLIPADMAVTDEMKDVLKITEVTKPDEVYQLATSIQPVPAVIYSEVLGETAVPLEACRIYSLLLAHELRAYLESRVTAKVPLSNEEVGIMKRMSDLEKVRTFGCHLRQLMRTKDLPLLMMRSLRMVESVFDLYDDSNHANVD